MNRKLRGNCKKSVALMVSMVLLLALTIGGTLAFLLDTSGPVVNIFNPTNVPPLIVEDIEGAVKEAVTIKNNGTASAYVRAKVLVTWQDITTGSVYGTAPVDGKDYSMSMDTTGAWQLGWDGYYYYTDVVPANGETSALFTDGKFLKSTADVPIGYELHMEIITQTIQAAGEDDSGNKPVLLVWGGDNGSVKSVGQNGKLTILTSK